MDRVIGTAPLEDHSDTDDRELISSDDDESEDEQEEAKEDAQTDLAAAPPPQVNPHTTQDPADLEELWQRTRDSRDKIYFIRHTPWGDNRERWYAVQIDIAETNAELARKEGRYKAKWLTANAEDSRKKPLRDCRYWPCIHKFMDRTSDTFGPMILLHPNRVQAHLKTGTTGWYQQTINLWQQRLTGPFNYWINNSKPRAIHYLINPDEWHTLQQKLATTDITDDTEGIHPIYLVQPANII